jgi:hypothetical protein
MSIEKVHPSGAYRVSDIVKGYLVTRVYMGYTKRQALAMFKQEVKK